MSGATPVPGVLLLGECPPRTGGIATHVQTLSQRLSLRGIPTVRWDSKDITRSLGADDLELRMGFTRRLFERTWLPATRFVLHVHASAFGRLRFAFPIIELAFHHRCPIALSIHHGNLANEYDQFPLGTRQLIGYAIRRADRIISVSVELDEFIESRFRVAPQRRWVCPAFLGVGGETLIPFPSEIESFIQRRRDAGDRIALMTCYDGRRAYGVREAVEALGGRTGVSLVVIAHGASSADFDATRANCQHQPSLLFHSGVSHETFMTLLRTCDVYLRPTTEDGDSVTIREALKLGIPVVATDVVARPDGVHLFRWGDGHGMRAAILADDLGSSRGIVRDAPGDDLFEGILRVYGDMLRTR